MKTFITLIHNIFCFRLNFLILFILLISAAALNAQDVRIPVSETSTTAKFYTYTYNINSTTKKDIQYFVVQDADGNIKTAFNACEVCYRAYKGYSQRTTVMHCNNCGNEYQISNLGTQGTGGCWPGYLPHTISGDEIVITIPNIEAGAYLFKEQQISAVNETPKDLPSSFILSENSNELNLIMPSSLNRNIRIFDLNGQNLYTVKSNSSELSLSTGNLVSGVYILTIEEANKVYFRMINLGR